MENKFNYETSKDYERLSELLKTYSIVCFVSSTRYGHTLCEGRYNARSNIYTVGGVGIAFIEAWDYRNTCAKDDFIEQCVKLNLEFIDIKGTHV